MPVNPLEHESDKGVHFDVTHRHNLGVLLRLTHKYGTVSRSQLSRDLGLNRSTIHSIIQELSAQNMFRFPGSEAKAIPGRPSMMIQINPAFFTLTFALSKRSLVSAEVHLGDPVRVQKMNTTSIEGMSAIQIVEIISTRIASAIGNSAPSSVLLGVALSVPGEVSQPEGVVTSLELGWQDFSLKSQLHKELPNDLHIDVGTEADVGALAEKSFGGAKDLRNFCFLSGINELSAGLVVNGGLLTGRAGSAGRLSRVSVAQSRTGLSAQEGTPLQSLIGYNALLKQVQELGFDSIESFYASEDDTKKKELQSHVINILSSLFQNLVVLLGLEKIFLELELANYWSELSGKDIEEFNELLGFSDSVIVRSSLGTDVVQLGLGELGFELLFEHPDRYFAKAKLLK